MEINKFIFSVLEQDWAPVVLCDLEHTIVYMNPAAKLRYKADLTGKSLTLCHNSASNALIERTLVWFAQSAENNSVHESFNEKENKDVYIVALRDEEDCLIGYYEKHEYRTRDLSAFYHFV